MNDDLKAEAAAMLETLDSRTEFLCARAKIVSQEAKLIILKAEVEADTRSEKIAIVQAKFLLISALLVCAVMVFVGVVILRWILGGG